MPYTKTTWVDKNVQYPNRYTDQNNNTYTFTPSPGTVTAAGTAVNAVNLNKIEQGIDDAHAAALENSIELAKGLFTVQAQMAAGLNSLSQMAVDAFNDETGISSKTNQVYDSTNKFYRPNFSARNTVTANGGAKIVTSTKKIGTSSLAFPSAGSYLSVPDSSDWDFGSADFCIRFWVNFFSLPTSGNTMTLISQYADANNFWRYELYNNAGTYQVYFVVKSGGTSLANEPRTITPSTGTWYHFELDRVGNVIRFFLDGSKLSTDFTFSSTMPNVAGLLNIGRYENGGTNYFNGYIDELEIVKGTYRNSANFTPYTTELTADGNTVLLLKGEGADQSTTIADSALGTALSMTLISNSLTCASAPTKAYVVVDETLNSATFTYSISRDNGTTWTTASKDALVDISGQPSGTQLKIKLVTSGGTSSSPPQIKAWAFGYK